MRLIKATEKMLAAARDIVPSQEEILARGFIESGDYMCLGTNGKGALGQYWGIFVTTCFNGMELHCAHTVLPFGEIDGNLELQVYKESPNLIVKRGLVGKETQENWQETCEYENLELFEKKLSYIPEEKLYLVFTLQDFFNQGTWGWYWEQRCLRFVGVGKINRPISLERKAIVWDIVEEKYAFDLK